MSVPVEKIGDAIWEKLEKWSNETTIKFSDTVLTTTKQARDEIKKITPTSKDRKEGEHYINTYKIKPNQLKTNVLMERVLWNKKYQLSHLIENGHLVYTRLGRKDDINARKIGPLDIKKRTADKTLSTISDNKHTSKYGMWEHTEKYAGDKLLENLKKQFK